MITVSLQAKMPRKSVVKEPSFRWDDLTYWQTGEWQVVQENLDDLDRKHVGYNPPRHLLFASMDACPFDRCKAVIVGQDPYPTPGMATGVAFSVPTQIKPNNFPRTLKILFQEYVSDLGLPAPSVGSLLPWAKQGVLLWNIFPSCLWGKPKSHDWVEYHFLTEEIIKKLSEKKVVFVFLGREARWYERYVDQERCRVITTSHPSPLGASWGFRGSRIFSNINIQLNELEVDPIDWRL